mgnify:CR=1 FL=1
MHEFERNNLNFLISSSKRLDEFDQLHDLHTNRTSPILRSASKAELIHYMISSHSFTRREITRLHRLPIFMHGTNSFIQLRDPLLPTNLAYLLFVLLFICVGIWIGWIVYAAPLNSHTVSTSAIAGIVFGYAFSLISDFSVRHMQIVHKLKSLESAFN